MFQFTDNFITESTNSSVELNINVKSFISVTGCLGLRLLSEPGLLPQVHNDLPLYKLVVYTILISFHQISVPRSFEGKSPAS